MGGIKETRKFESTLAQDSFLPRTIKMWNEKLPGDIRSEELIWHQNVNSEDNGINYRGKKNKLLKIYI